MLLIIQLDFVSFFLFSEMDWIDFTATSGVIESPNFPLPYPSKAVYTYTINILGASEITLSLTSFQLEDGYDFVYLGRGTVPSTLNQAEIVFATNITEITLQSSTVWIRFISDIGNPSYLRDLQFSLKWEAKSKLGICKAL